MFVELEGALFVVNGAVVGLVDSLDLGRPFELPVEGSLDVLALEHLLQGQLAVLDHAMELVFDCLRRVGGDDAALLNLQDKVERRLGAIVREGALEVVLANWELDNSGRGDLSRGGLGLLLLWGRLSLSLRYWLGLGLRYRLLLLLLDSGGLGGSRDLCVAITALFNNGKLLGITGNVLEEVIFELVNVLSLGLSLLLRDGVILTGGLL